MKYIIVGLAFIAGLIADAAIFLITTFKKLLSLIIKAMLVVIAVVFIAVSIFFIYIACVTSGVEESGIYVNEHGDLIGLEPLSHIKSVS